ncbi:MULTISPECIES: type IV secretion system protein [Rhizobium]|uniref:Type IV secretion system protein VirB6 n=2 Tax=Rhizobium TaxID=379 RepID=K0Q421_9HYPH|nr:MULTISPECIES: type IV secretion system protein [Rhizobium]KWV51285.1 type IV secretion system protein VirB6 [Rhizobium altiplani]CCM79760.1 Type IV secretion system protein VirB6 [Rhizobium mesoamericanum STM3625]
MKFTIAAPFTATHEVFGLAFEVGLHKMLGTIQDAVRAPLAAFVTLWIIIQGVLVMRGATDARSGVTRVITVTIVVALILGQANYHDYVVSVFEKTIPNFVQKVSGSHLPLRSMPAQLDIIFSLTEAAFQRVAAEIGPMNGQDSLAFQGAQLGFYAILWSTFGILDTVGILTKVLLAIGPLVLVGYIFDRTRDIAAKWIGQLITYGLLLLLLNVVATIVIATEISVLAIMLGVVMVLGTTAAKIIGLYELDMFFLTGNALIVALPPIAGNIAGSYWAGSAPSPNSVYRRFAQVERREAPEKSGAK